VKVVFLNALETEDLLEPLEWRLDHPEDVDLNDDSAPVLLAVSDNGPEMRSDETRAFMALMTIGRHFGRPSTPTDQAWIESLWGHIKAENPYLLAITNPAVLAVELERVRHHYNNIRLHESIGANIRGDVEADSGKSVPGPQSSPEAFRKAMFRNKSGQVVLCFEGFHRGCFEQVAPETNLFDMLSVAIRKLS
jgi:putative transposase